MDLQRFFGCLPDEDAKRVGEAWRAAVAGAPYDLVHRVRDGATAIRWVRERAEITRDADGRPLLAIGTVQDITDSHDEHERLVLALDAGQLAVWEWNVPARTMTCHEGDELRLGFEKGIQYTLAQWDAALHPLDRESAIRKVEDFERSRSDFYENEFRVRGRDGSWRWVRSVGRVVLRDAEGRASRVIGTYQNTTRTKETALELQTRGELLEAAQSAADFGFAVYDLESRRFSWSRHLYVMLGYKPQGVDPSPLALLQRLHPEDRNAVDLTATTDLVEDQLCRIVLPDGTKRLGIWRQVVQRDGIGRALRVVTTVKDVTELYHIRQLERQTQKSEALARLAAGMAHDFNNLLGVVVGNLDVLRDRGDLDAAALKNLDTALSAAVRGGEITRSLVTVAGERPYAEQTIELNEHLRELMPLLAQSAGAKAQFSVRLGEEPLPVRLDPSGLDSVILNLVVNARDALAGGGKIRLLTRRLDQTASSVPLGLKPGTYAEIRITDDGTGMPPEVLERAFDPFFSTKERGRGTGLGLALCKGYAQQAGGGIAIDSRPDAGTVVRLLLPIAKAGAESPPASPGQPAAPSGKAAVAGLRVLLVEDEKPLRTVALAMLAQAGCSVRAAADASEARACLEQETFDVLVSDLVMPGELDGIELTRWAGERFPGMGILVVTGLADQVGSISLPWPLLKKPYRARQLLEAVAKARSQAAGPGPVAVRTVLNKI